MMTHVLNVSHSRRKVWSSYYAFLVSTVHLMCNGKAQPYTYEYGAQHDELFHLAIGIMDGGA